MRTDPSVEQRQDGISFLLIDMKTPGITVRPLMLMDGAHEVNEVFFDDVKVPAENLVHEEGKGWTVAKYLLGYERMGTGRIGESKRELPRSRSSASAQGRQPLEDPRFRDRLSRLEVELMALEITNLRFLDRMRRSGQPPGADVSMLKIKGTEIQQALTELMMQAAGPFAQPSGRRATRLRPLHGGAGASATANAQDDDLRRVQRDPAQHHRQDDPGAVRQGQVMNFDYNEEQQLLADTVRRFLAKDYDFDARGARSSLRRRAGARTAWATLAEMGLLGLRFPAEHGGFGGGAVDLMGVMEAFGEALVVEPYLPTLMGGLVGSRAARWQRSILPAVVEGKMKLAFAHAENGARYDLGYVRTRARKAGEGWTLEGEKAGVVGAPMADRIVVSAAAPDGIALFLVVKIRRRSRIARWTSCARPISVFRGA